MSNEERIDLVNEVMKRKKSGQRKIEKPESSNKTKFKTFESYNLEILGDKIQEWFDKTGNKLVQITHAVEKTEYSKNYSAIVVYEKKEKEENKRNNEVDSEIVKIK